VLRKRAANEENRSRTDRFAWIAYVGTTGYVVWRALSGDLPPFLKNYTLGTNAAWVAIGVMLWVATEWVRDGKGRF
jgi:apolipoprotein N-acyltransferase